MALMLLMHYSSYHLRDLVVDVAGRGIPVLPDPVHARLGNSAALVADAYSDIMGTLADSNLLPRRRNTPTQAGSAARHGQSKSCHHGIRTATLNPNPGNKLELLVISNRYPGPFTQ